MWYWVISIFVAFIIIAIMKAYLVKNELQTSMLDYYDSASIFGPIFAGLFWPIVIIGGLCYFIYKKWLKKYYQRFVKWLGYKLFPDI